MDHFTQNPFNMKKRDADVRYGKLRFKKEKITNLSIKDLGKVLGGAAESTHNAFTCTWCTTTTVFS